MKILYVLIVNFFLFGSLTYTKPERNNVTNDSDRRVLITKIWDNGNHNAFTSLIKYKGKYYCAFREGCSHVFDENGIAEGKIRILVSSDGHTWESTALIGKENYDLRDPKLSVTPDDKLMVIVGGSIYKNRKLESRIPQVTFSKDGKDFSDPQPVEIDHKAITGKDWLWRVTWNKSVGYGVCYSIYGDNDQYAYITLLKTTDGINFSLVKKFDITGFPNETTIRFLPDDRMLMMVRREKDNAKGYWGVSDWPYTDWNFKAMEVRLGGPDFIPFDKDFIIAGTRSYYFPSHCKTILLTGNIQGDFQESYVLPSDGDTSYPGLLIEGDELWVSYYSYNGTQGKTAVYLAKLSLSILKNK